jgi:hypothetical protein
MASRKDLRTDYEIAVRKYQADRLTTRGDRAAHKELLDGTREKVADLRKEAKKR